MGIVNAINDEVDKRKESVTLVSILLVENLKPLAFLIILYTVV